MPDVSALVETQWSAPTGVNTGAFGVPWVGGTLVTSLGGAYTPGAAPPGSTPTAPNTDADFVIGPGPFYFVFHDVIVTDLRDDALLNFQSMALSTDSGSACWTLSAVGDIDLFTRFTTGDIPVVRVQVNGNTWDFVIEGIQRSRAFGDNGVNITGRSPTIVAAEPYQFPENWVNDGPSTAQQIAAQAQVYSELEVDFQLDDWLVPSRAFTFTGSPLAVVQRVAESVGAVMRADRVDRRISLLPRYPSLPNEWREEVPNVDIHLDIVKADSYERADQPSFNGIYVAGQAEGQIAKVYLAGTSGDKLAPMVTDALLTEQIALRQRGVAELGKGGPQAVIRITLPVLSDPGFPGVFEINWLCRVIEPGLTWYGMVRAVSVAVEFGRVSQTITLERHTADITGTVVAVPAEEPPPPAAPLGWRDPINSATPAGVSIVAGSHIFNDATTGVSYYGVHTEAVLATPTTWALTWIPLVADPAPSVTVSSGAGAVVTLTYPAGPTTSLGTALLVPSVDGIELATRLRMVSSEFGGGETTSMDWSVEPNV